MNLYRKNTANLDLYISRNYALLYLLKYKETCTRLPDTTDNVTLSLSRWNLLFIRLWVIGIDTNIEVIVVSLTTWEAYHSELWWASRVVNETTMTEIEVSISILSWWNQINDELTNTVKFVAKLSLVTAWLHVYILWSCDLIVFPW